MRDRWPEGVSIDDPVDHDDLCALLERFDELITDGPSKIGSGISHFETRFNRANGGFTKGFWVIRNSGDATDFSFIAAVDGRSPGVDARFVEACRESIYPAVVAAKKKCFATRSDDCSRVPCEITGELINYDGARIDHAPRTLRDLAWDFRVQEGWSQDLPSGVISEPTDAQLTTTFIDTVVMLRFIQFHREKAVLRVVSKVLSPKILASTRHLPVARPLILQE